MAKERPLLMSTEMVKADREGRKTMTRRTAGLDQVNEKPDDWALIGQALNKDDGRLVFGFENKKTGEILNVRCPYGQIGDRLWIRETWAANSDLDKYPPREISPLGKIWYAADGDKPAWAGKTRPGIFMPKELSRTTVEIVEIRVERLQDISEEDAKAEGGCMGGVRIGKLEALWIQGRV